MHFLVDVLRPETLNPIAFSIFGQEVRWYAIFILLGVLVAALIGYYGFGVRLGANSDIVFEGLTFGLISGVVGARLYYVIFNPSSVSSFWDIFNPRSGGLAIHGAIYGTAIFLMIYCRVRKLNLLILVEIIVPVFLLAQAFGRWGNFFNQEAFGGIVNGYTTGPLTDAQLIAQREALRGLLVPNFVINQMYITNFRGLDILPIVGYYYPTFYFESIANFLGFLVMMVPRRFTRKLYLGDGLTIYLTWYGITRFFIEGMRTDPLMLGNIRIARLMSVLFIVGGVAIFALRRVFKYKLIPSYDVFYGDEGASIWLEGHPPVPKEKEKLEKKQDDNE
jgi:phosphatidylglycerol:prolipoprotein diacylglycerol transferase